jgi:hypothetical protein
MEAVAGVGAAVLVLAWLGLVAGAGRTRLLAVIWIAIGALVATRTPLFDVLQSVPTLAIGNPRRWLFLVALGASLLVGEGVRALARATPGRLGVASLLALPAVVPFTAAFVAPEGTATWLARMTQSPEPLARANVAAPRRGTSGADGRDRPVLGGAREEGVALRLGRAACDRRGGARPPR